MDFEDDREALILLKSHGYRETGNGIIHGDWGAMNEECRAAVRYLCDEWDFMFTALDDGKDTTDAPV